MARQSAFYPYRPTRRAGASSRRALVTCVSSPAPPCGDREERGCVPDVRWKDLAAPIPSMLEAFQRAFEKAGVVFLEPGDIRDGGEGVRLKKPKRRR